MFIPMFQFFSRKNNFSYESFSVKHHDEYYCQQDSVIFAITTIITHFIILFIIHNFFNLFNKLLLEYFLYIQIFLINKKFDLVETDSEEKFEITNGLIDTTILFTGWILMSFLIE